MNDMILILDFGSQYTQLIARRVRELNVYCEVHPYSHTPPLTPAIKGIILSGSPSSVHDPKAPNINLDNLQNVPVLGICYGAQLMASHRGGEVIPSKHREYGQAKLSFVASHDPLMQGIPIHSSVWMSHGDSISSLPDSFSVLARTSSVPIVAFKQANRPQYGIQFHPEVTHSDDGKNILRNFVIHICQCTADWTPDQFIERSITQLKDKLKDDKVIMGLSGGVDSTVAATLLHQAIGKNLHCLFIDNGLLRKNEFQTVLSSYTHMGLNVSGVNAQSSFYKALRGQLDPEAKRKVIGKEFIDIFERESLRINHAKWLGQGTIYPDIIESVSVYGPSVTIKSHHNVGGLPKKMKLKIIEPLKLLFKDEVRMVGRALKIDNTILDRHPFPGPGLGIRIIGEVTPQRVLQLQEADDIFISKLREHNLYHDIWQASTILLPPCSVGVMGDNRTYEQVIALRAVSSVDGMTANWVQIPEPCLRDISSAIINNVEGVNRVVYDISSKPPSTIEWE